MNYSKYVGFGESRQKEKANLFDAHLKLAIRLGLWTRLVQRPDTSRFATYLRASLCQTS